MNKLLFGVLLAIELLIANRLRGFFFGWFSLIATFVLLGICVFLVRGIALLRSRQGTLSPEKSDLFMQSGVLIALGVCDAAVFLFLVCIVALI